MTISDKLIDTKLADRTASAPAAPATTAAAPSSPRPPSTASDKDRIGTPVKGKASTKSPQPEDSPTELLSRLRADLATTQKARSGLQSQVDELTSSLKELEVSQKASTSQINFLTQQKTAVERRLRDRDEELRGKTKLAEDVQDEMVAMGLQLNVAEAKSEKLTKENKELVERWMKRMGEEADRVNRDSNWD